MTIKAVQYHPDFCKEAKIDLDQNGHKPWRWDSSHDLSIIKDGERIKIGSFRHAYLAQEAGDWIEKHGLDAWHKAIWEVCTFLRADKCDQCPKMVHNPTYGWCHKGCREMAEETISVVLAANKRVSDG